MIIQGPLICFFKKSLEAIVKSRRPYYLIIQKTIPFFPSQNTIFLRFCYFQRRKKILSTVLLLFKFVFWRHNAQISSIPVLLSQRSVPLRDSTTVLYFFFSLSHLKSGLFYLILLLKFIFPFSSCFVFTVFRLGRCSG